VSSVYLLAEILHAKSFLAWGFRDPEEFLTRQFKFSRESAQRRIEAARLVLRQKGMSTDVKTSRLKLVSNCVFSGVNPNSVKIDAYSQFRRGVSTFKVEV
jgi:hypothetical protein